jgi:hypothetical protein
VRTKLGPTTCLLWYAPAPNAPPSVPCWYVQRS